MLKRLVNDLPLEHLRLPQRKVYFHDLFLLNHRFTFNLQIPFTSRFLTKALPDSFFLGD